MRSDTRQFVEAGTSSDSASNSPSLRGRLFRLNRLQRLGRQKRWGATAVEFAVVAPVFFLLVFGMIEYGRMIMVQQVITNAAREGARRAVLAGSTADDVHSTVNSYLTSANVSGASVDIDPNNPDSADFGAPITVNVTIPFSSVSWLPSPMFLGNTNLTAQSVMRRESVQGGGS